MVKLHLSPFQALVEEAGGCSALLRGQGSLLSQKQPLQERRAFPSSWLAPEFSSLACLLFTGYSRDLGVDIGKEGIN